MSDQPAAVSPPPTVDPQDPLPESKWFWRRVFVFVFGGIAMVFLFLAILWVMQLGWYALDLVGKIAAMRDAKALDNALDTAGKSIEVLGSTAFWLIILVLADRILYLIAPSAEQAAKMMATVSAWKGGVSTASTSRATAPDGSTASATVTAGPAQAAPAPPAAPILPTPAGHTRPPF